MKTARFWFPFVCFLSVYVSGQSPAVGRTAGELAVSATGAATYSVPLTLPPGIGEVVPSLALTYNSQAGDGIAG